jgi:hypothetical protein
LERAISVVDGRKHESQSQSSAASASAVAVAAKPIYELRRKMELFLVPVSTTTTQQLETPYSAYIG